MIDFTDMPRKNKTYAGANGGKISIIYNDELYMLKFPAASTQNKADMSYLNSCISEYIGCKIYAGIGIPVQDVLLGTFRTKGKEKIVVACKDFTVSGTVLQDFASLKNQIVDSEHNGYGTELSDILETFEQQTAFDSQVLSERFWDMFIVDCLIGNWDRHNGNWGFLYNEKNDSLSLAPVFDCGSSLFPRASEAVMEKVLSNKAELNNRIFTIPTSAIKQDNERINYFNFISSLKNKDCNNALIRIKEHIDMAKINAVIDETPFITDLHKTFLKTLLAERNEKILDFSLKRLQKSEGQET